MLDASENEEGHIVDTLGALVDAALTDFYKVASLAGASYDQTKLDHQIHPMPHAAPSLPAGKIAAYAFFLNGRALNVGKVGQKSAARFVSQHYLPNSAMSNLAKSILTHPASVGASGLDATTVGDWIKAHTDRVSILMPADFGLPLLSLLEAFLHVRWKPLFEGRMIASAFEQTTRPQSGDGQGVSG